MDLSELCSTASQICRIRPLFGFVNPPNYDHDLEFEMSGSDVLIGLRLGFDVIFDGNWTATADDPLLAKWFSAHPEENVTTQPVWLLWYNGTHDTRRDYRCL